MISVQEVGWHLCILQQTWSLTWLCQGGSSHALGLVEPIKLVSQLSVCFSFCQFSVIWILLMCAFHFILLASVHWCNLVLLYWAWSCSCLPVVSVIKRLVNLWVRNEVIILERYVFGMYSPTLLNFFFHFSLLSLIGNQKGSQCVEEWCDPILSLITFLLRSKANPCFGTGTVKVMPLPCFLCNYATAKQPQAAKPIAEDHHLGSTTS